ncbi:MAG: 4Fe-4S binding protein [Treponema sp.]
MILQIRSKGQKCVDCGECVEQCPVNALKVGQKSPCG